MLDARFARTRDKLRTVAALSSDPVWRTCVTLSFAVSIAKSGALGGILQQFEWNVLQFGPILVAIVWMILSNDSPALRKADRFLIWAMVAVVATAVLSTIFSVSPATTIYQSGVLAILTAFLLLTTMKRWDRRERIDSDLVLIFAIVSLNQLFGLCAAALGAKWALGDYSRFVGTLSNANYAGMLSAVALAIGIHLVTLKRGAFRIVIGVGMAILAVAMLWSGSRGSLLAVVLGTVLVLGLRRAWRTLIALLLIIVAAAAAIVVFMPGILSRVSNSDLTSGRVEIYESMIRNWLQRPVLGTGFRTAQLLPGNEGLAGHNIFLSVLTETGVLGFISFLAVLVAVCLCGRGNSMAGAAATVIIIELTESSIYGWGGPTSTISWLALMSYAALGRSNSSRSEAIARAETEHSQAS